MPNPEAKPVHSSGRRRGKAKKTHKQISLLERKFLPRMRHGGKKSLFLIAICRRKYSTFSWIIPSFYRSPPLLFPSSPKHSLPSLRREERKCVGHKNAIYLTRRRDLNRCEMKPNGTLLERERELTHTKKWPRFHFRARVLSSERKKGFNKGKPQKVAACKSFPCSAGSSFGLNARLEGRMSEKGRAFEAHVGWLYSPFVADDVRGETGWLVPQTPGQQGCHRMSN